MAPALAYRLFPDGFLPLPAELGISAPIGPVYCIARLTPVAASEVAGVSYQLDLEAQNPSNYPGVGAGTFEGVTWAPHVFDYTLMPPSATVAGTLRLRVYTRGGYVDGSASGRVEFDLDGDGVADVTVVTPAHPQDWRTQTLERDVPFVLEATQKPRLRMSARAEVSGWGRAAYSTVNTTVLVEFAWGAAATSIPYGTACGAAIEGFYEIDRLDAINPSLRRTVEVDLRGAPANAPAVLALGIDRVQVPIPGTACTLLTTPLAWLPVVTDATGRAVVRQDLPESVAGTLSCQFAASVPQGGLVTTGALSLVIR